MGAGFAGIPSRWAGTRPGEGWGVATDGRTPLLGAGVALPRGRRSRGGGQLGARRVVACGPQFLEYLSRAGPALGAAVGHRRGERLDDVEGVADLGDKLGVGDRRA